MGCQIFKSFGLPGTSVKEAKERVKTAIKNSGIEFLSRRIIINLSPANTRKEGSMLDLPIAIGILIANREIKNPNLARILMETIFIGELSLNGDIEKVNGILPMCVEAKRLGIKKIIIPRQNWEEASILEGIEILPVSNLKEIIDYLNDKKEIIQEKYVTIRQKQKIDYEVDFAEVKGQESVKRALEIAASGGHNCLLIRFTRSRKNYVSKKTTYYFARYEIRRIVRSYKNLQYTRFNFYGKSINRKKTIPKPTSYDYTSIFNRRREKSKTRRN